MSLDEKLMRLALKQAQEAAERGEVPIGAVLLLGDEVFKGHNLTISKHDPSAHAEIIVLRDAGEALKNHRFPDGELFVTLEPCAMCLGALMQARIRRLVFAASDKRFGACGSCLDLNQGHYFNHKIRSIENGLFAEESVNLLQSFFRARR